MTATPSAGGLSLVDVVRLSVVVVAAEVLQQTVLDPLRLHGAHADVLLLVEVAAGYVAGPDRGAGIGFVVGLVADCFLPTPFGLSALVGCLLGWVAGLVGLALQGSGLTGSGWWPASAVLALGAAAGTVGYAIVDTLLGAPHLLTAYLPAAVVMIALGGLVLGPAVVVATRWAVPTSGSAASSASIGAGGTATIQRTRPGGPS